METTFTIPTAAIPNFRKKSPALSKVLKTLLELSCKACKVSFEEALSDSRTHEVSDARKIYVVLSKNVINARLPWVRVSEAMGKTRSNAKYGYTTFNRVSPYDDTIRGSYNRALELAASHKWL